MDPPSGLIAVPVSQAVLLLTEAEYGRGIRRGTWWTQIQAEAKRKAAAVTLQTPRASRTLSTLLGACAPTGVRGTGTRSRAGGSR